MCICNAAFNANIYGWINPFTTAARKLPGLKCSHTHTLLQTVFFRSYNKCTSLLCILTEILSRTSAEKEIEG